MKIKGKFINFNLDNRSDNAAFIKAFSNLKKARLLTDDVMEKFLRDCLSESEENIKTLDNLLSDNSMST